ncbi:MAG: hypothetical protein ACOVLC_12035 [Flavobacterium sp.]
MKFNYIIFFLFSVISFGQNGKTKLFYNKQIFKYKISTPKQNYYNSKNSFVPTQDTLNYFVDERNYKVIQEHDVVFFDENNMIRDVIEINTHNTFEIHFTKLQYHKKDSVFIVEGKIKDGWDGRGYQNFRNNVDVFIGNYQDTISYSYAPDYLYETKIVFKGKETQGIFPIDSFPSIYMKNYSRFTTKAGNDRVFSIKGKINPKSILAFGLRGHEASIFDVGSLVFKQNLREIQKESWKKDNDLNEENNIVKTNTDLYFEQVNIAEQFIVQGYLKRALDVYAEVFRKNNYAFAVDLNNAIRVSLALKRFGSTLYFSKMLASKGVPLSFFNASDFDEFKTTKEWKMLKVAYPKLKSNFESTKSLALINGLNQLVQEDQAVYEKHARKEVERIVLKPTTDSITRKWIELVSKHGFPSEEKIGVRIKNDTVIIPRHEYAVLIAHAHQTNCDYLLEMKKVLYHAKDSLLFNTNSYDVKDLLREPNLIIYKGNLYKQKGSQSNVREIEKIKFIFNQKNAQYIMKGNYRIYAVDQPDEDDSHITMFYDLITKLTDDWYFYEK